MHAAIVLFWSKVVDQALFFAVAIGAMTALELLLPRPGGQRGARGHAVVFWLLWIPCTAIFFTAFTLFWRAVGWRPVFSLRLGEFLAHFGPARLIIAPLLVALVGDFFFYWFHRAQHAFFWPLHAVHHSIEDLNAANSYHHATEELMRSLLYSLPASWFTIDEGPSLPILALWFSLQPVFIHCPTRVNFGPWRLFFADNHFHRIHHSVESKHFGRNFGAITTLWDRIFGTAYFPDRDEWPRTGIEGVPAPTSVRAWLVLPLALMRKTESSAHSAMAAQES